MLMLFALSLGAAPAADSPARRIESGATASFTATAHIVRAVAIGKDHKKPNDAQMRETMLADAAGDPRPAVVYDFE